MWTLEQDTLFVIFKLLKEDVIPNFENISEQSSISYGLDSMLEYLDIQELITEVDGAYLLTPCGREIAENAASEI